jgi:hypothetical protein
MTSSHRDRERPHASRVVSLAIGMVSMMLASTVAQTPRSPELDQILQRAAAHVEQQARAMSDIVMQEDYLQVAKGTVRGHDPRTSRHARPARISSCCSTSARRAHGRRSATCTKAMESRSRTAAST